MFSNYLAAALRNLQRSGLYAALTVMGLAIGFASAILIGLYVRHELTYDRFIPGHERTFIWNQVIMQQGKAPLNMDLSSARLIDDLKLDFPQIEYSARQVRGGFPPTIRHGDISVSEQAFSWVDPDFFKVLPLPAVAGDLATALDAPDALVLTRTSARKYFHRDAPLGETLLVDGHPMRVTAVMEDLPSNTNLASNIFASATSPYSQMKQLYDAGYSSNSSRTFVRLKPGASMSDFNKALPAFLQRRIIPQLGKIDPDLRFVYKARLKPITDMHLDYASGDDGGDPKVVAGMAIIGVLIVIVAAINFVTLMTARASRRAMEVGVRKALGAERKDLIVQFMGEAFIYVVIALAFAVALAELLLPAVNAALLSRMTFHYLSDPALLASMIGVTLVTGLLAGLYPALVLSSFRPASVLKGGPIAGGGGGGRVRQALVVAQFAVLITLILATATIYRQTLFGLKEATHTNKDNVVMLFASPCTDTLRDAVRAVPGVVGAACSSPMAVNLTSSVDVVNFKGRNVSLGYAPIDFGFFDIYGVKPMAGRLFSAERPADNGEHMTEVSPTIVINQTAARALGFANPRDAVGQMVAWHFNPNVSVSNLAGPTPPARASEVIGVVPDFTFAKVDAPISSMFFYIGPKNDMLSSVALNIKLNPTQAKAALKQIDQIWARISGGQPLQQYYADQFLLNLYIGDIIEGGFMAVCALVAVSIACLGLFALSAFTAERRTKEIGVRKAMGASSLDILKLLLWQFAKPVLLANVIAWPLGYVAMIWWLRGFAYHVEPSALTFVGAAIGAVVIAMLTVASQSWSVARARPVRALRYE